MSEQGMTTTKELVRFKELKEMLGVSRSTIWRWETMNEFPKHYNLGANTVVWRRSEIDDWLNKKQLDAECLK